MVGAWLFGAFVLLAIFGPLFVGDPLAYVGAPHGSPSAAHWFGTTGQGQDVLAQVVVGTRVSLLLGVLVGVVVVSVGALVGVSAALAGPRGDRALNLLINVFLVIPGLPLAIVLAAFLPKSPWTIAAVLMFTGWAWNARVLRAQAMAIRDRDFVAAAICAGESRLGVLWREVLPQLRALLMAQFIGAIIFAIGAQVGLEYIGVGDISVTTWGTNLYWAANDSALLTGSWWTFVPTGVMIALLSFALVMLNFGVDELANPRLTTGRIFDAWLRTRNASVGPDAATPIVPLVQDGPQEDARP